MDQMVCIVGPTASGKTRLSVALAEVMDAEIVSFDSMQIYRGMDIGTAKPTPEEMHGIPHHMIGMLDPCEAYSVSRYVQEADGCVQDILARGKPVVLVGGTGLYIDSLIAGRQFAPYPETGRREELMQLAACEGIEAVLEQLRRVDPEAAARLHPSNQKRIIRAMEVYLETGKTITEHDRESRAVPPKYQPFWLGLNYIDRAVLYERINRRVDNMMEAGLLDEVQGLLDAGIPETATSMQAIGYKELVGALRGENSLQSAVEEIKQASRRYAKRQMTWFRRNEAVHWMNIEETTTFNEIFYGSRQILPFLDKVI